MIGGPSQTVVVDETFLVKRRFNQGGFGGDISVSMKTVLLGGVELEGPKSARRVSQNLFLVEIKNHNMQTLVETIERPLRKHGVA
jgi:hypothetical protein